jgi:ribosomal protein L32
MGQFAVKVCTKLSHIWLKANPQNSCSKCGEIMVDRKVCFMGFNRKVFGDGGFFLKKTEF